MSLVSMQFFTFIAVALIGYYLIPKRFQWIWLLLFSYVYYISYGIKYVFLYYTLHVLRIFRHCSFIVLVKKLMIIIKNL